MWVTTVDWRRVRHDVKWGARRGLAAGAAYSLIAMLILSQRDDGATGISVSLGAILGLYLSGGLVAGIIVGAFRPLAEHRIGAYVLGVMAISPVIIGGFILISGPPGEWNRIHWLGIAVMSVGIGAAIGSEMPGHDEAKRG